MSWNHTQQSTIPHVENFFTQATVPNTPAQTEASYWPTPSTESGLNHINIQYQEHRITRTRRGAAKTSGQQNRGLGLHMNSYRAASGSLEPNHISPHLRQAQSIAAPTPQRLLASPASFGGQRILPSPATAHPFTNIPPTPPSAGQFFTPGQQPPHQQPFPMSQQRRVSSHGHRPVMGPPETPSRGMIPQSPSLFPNIQFSPDLFSQQMMDPSSAPVYPQQRLFWDPATATPIQGTPQHFHTPTAFPDDFTTSFSSNSTIVPPTFVTQQQEMPYDLPTIGDAMTPSFMNGAVFPAPFQTSPRMPPPQPDNPTHFLSSPARRFGGEPKQENLNTRRSIPDLPAYHHQMQESKREKELLARDRRKSRPTKRSIDDDLVMKSVRRALSPKKNSRPMITRSATLAGLQSGGRRSLSAVADNVSIGSRASSRSTNAGRSSPIRQFSGTIRRSSASASSRSRSTVSLAIDQNGVARTVMSALPEDEDTEVDEDDLTDQLSSEDGNDQDMLYSFSGDPYADADSFTSRGDARDELRSNAYLSLGSDRVARIAKGASNPTLDPRLGGYDPASTIRRARTETLASTNTDATNSNAQSALKAIMQDRSRSASSHASTSSMQFHSSPPMQPGQLPGYNHSPATITDPDLATPSTDADSHSSAGGTRCVCKSSSPDGNIMIQCDSCSKWLHAKCVGLNNRNIPDVYVCIFCEQTPIRGGTIRGGTVRQSRSLFGASQSPLAHKSHHRPR